MLCKVTHCAGRVSANTRPHQPCWGDHEMGNAIPCTECSEVARSVTSEVASSVTCAYMYAYAHAVQILGIFARSASTHTSLAELFYNVEHLQC